MCRIFLHNITTAISGFLVQCSIRNVVPHPGVFGDQSRRRIDKTFVHSCCVVLDKTFENLETTQLSFYLKLLNQ